MPRLKPFLPFISKERSFGSVFFWGRCASALGLVVLVLAWLVTDHYPPWTSFHSEMLAFVAFTLLLTGRLAMVQGPVAWPRWLGFLGFVAIVPWVQWFCGLLPFVGDAVVVTLYFAGFFGAVAVGYSYSANKTAKDTPLTGLMHVLWCGALLSACVGLLQWLSLEEVLGDFVLEGALGGRVPGNLGQPNHLSTLLLMGGVAMAYAHERGLIRGTVLALGAAFLSLVLVLTSSRSGLVGVVAVSIFMVCKSRGRALQLPVRGVVIWGSGFLLATWLLPHLSQWLLVGDRGLSLTTTSGRLVMWEQVARGIAERPWLGYGWGQTVRAHMAGVLSVPGDQSTNYAHNVLLDLLAWNGVPLGLALIGVGAYWLFSRLWRVQATNGVYAMACLLPLMVHGMVEYPFAYSYFLLPAGVMVGVVEASLGSASVKLPKSMVLAGLSVWLVLGGFFVHEYFLIEEDFRITRFENLRIGKTPPGYEVPTIRLTSHMAAMLKASRIRPVPGLTQPELDNLREVSRRFAFSVLNYRCALALGLNGDPEGAARELAVMRGLYGAKQFQGVAEDFAEEAKKYPQLKAVKMP